MLSVVRTGIRDKERASLLLMLRMRTPFELF